ncbi:hypothetical protein [Marisediminicola senii]|uniref:hypothetical protein n=1 Tax=Marisediminicola senii TaxID=2711233 RepID=UPI0013EC423D|nr:hypothetical protein [Marisediminicola senii]
MPYVAAIVGDRLSLSPHPDLDQYHEAAGETGTAVDILWPTHASSTAQVVRSGTEILALEKSATDVSIRFDGQVHTVPWDGDIRIILDGPILELSSRAGVFACPIEPLQGEWRLEVESRIVV